MFFVYETHGIFSGVEQFWSSLGFNLMFALEARGHAGGIWVLSSSNDLSFTLVDTMIQAITFSIQKGNARWFCSAVYASPVSSVQGNLWDHLIALRNSIQGPWMVIGDLNEILYSTEVAGGSFLPSRANLLANVLHQCNFIDLHTIDGLYTWRKNVQNGGHVRKRLDRCIKGVHRQLDFHPSSNLLKLERDLQKIYDTVLHQEKLLWFQKSRENWVKFGNRNTKFFHTQAVVRKRRNNISGLNVDGVWCTDEEVLEREALSFFKQLFQSNNNAIQQA